MHRVAPHHVIPGSELTFTVVPPGAKGSLAAAVSFWKKGMHKNSWNSEQE